MTNTERPYWERKTLADMSTAEWEGLCDGCAKCCLHKLEDEDTAEVFYTRVVCRYLEQDSCRCGVYETRKQLVPTCVKLDRENLLETLPWMPNTCAYRLLHEGRPLPLWHPLIAGDRQAMLNASEAVTGKVISEEYVHPDGYEEHLIDWASADAEDDSGETS